MNHQTRQLLHRATRRFTAFSSFADLLQCAISHGYTPTLIPWDGHCMRDRIRIRALANQFNAHFEEIGSKRRCWQGSNH